MGLLLDLAVGAIAVVVTVSLGMLAWTLGVSTVVAMRRSRRQIATTRGRLRTEEARLLQASSRASEALRGMADRTRPMYEDRRTGA